MRSTTPSADRGPGAAARAARLAAALAAAAAFAAHAQTTDAAAAGAAAAPQWSVEPAWRGWSRNGRDTELAIRVDAPRAMRVELSIQSGAQRWTRGVDLQPGRSAWWRLPVAVQGEFGVTLNDGQGGLPEVRAWRPSLAEAPLLALAAPALQGWAPAGHHLLAVSAPDLPHHALAYGSVDALVIDAETLASLDREQQAALLASTAGCARVIAVGLGSAARAWIDRQAGCGAAMLRHVQDPASVAALDAALVSLQETPRAPGAQRPSQVASSLHALAGPPPSTWPGVALGLALLAALLVLAWTWLPVAATAVGLPALAALAALAWVVSPAGNERVLIWSEASSGESSARFLAVQDHVASGRGAVTMPVPELLAPAVRPCDPREAMTLHHGDDGSVSAGFDARLFGRTGLCFTGSFPISRALALERQRPPAEAGASGSLVARNLGPQAWPEGWLLLGAKVQRLPALAAGATAALEPLGREADAAPGPGGGAPDAALLRHARSRLPPSQPGALWPLDLSGVRGAPADTRGWLLLALKPPAP